MILTLVLSAFASIDEKCADYQIPDDYDETTQQDFLANYVSLATSFSPQHGPIPHEAGHGAIGVDLGVIPPLGCKRRFVLEGTKTEETNKSPVAPRLRVSFAFPKIGKFVPYAGLGYLPPVRLLGTTNVFVSGELGFGVPIGDVFQTGLRYHFTLAKVVGEVASPFNEGEEAFDDLFVGSTFGFDAMFGLDLGAVTPYAAVGFTDVSTYFYIGDNGNVTNNSNPYAGLTFSLGADTLIAQRLRVGAELYGAPGGYSSPIENNERLPGFGRYGHLYTGRVRIGIEL